MNERHKNEFRKLIRIKTSGSQLNERLSSLYVISALPAWMLDDFKKDSQVYYTELIKYTNLQSFRLENKIVRLAYALFHGDGGEKILLEDYLGLNNELKDVFIQALQLQYEESKMLEERFYLSKYF
jgi:endo-1,4-beta-mannosidase